MILALIEFTDEMSYGERTLQALLVAAICMGIVFLMLMLLWGIVALFKFLPKEKVKEEKVVAPKVNNVKPSLKMEDIKDEDMMVAALVASIDYHNETKQDVKVVSIKEL